MKRSLILFFGLILLLGFFPAVHAADPIEIALLYPDRPWPTPAVGPKPHVTWRRIISRSDLPGSV
jgi:hypothetical protein